MSNVDVKSAYCRDTLVLLLTEMRIRKLDDADVMILRMDFGGDNGPMC